MDAKAVLPVSRATLPAYRDDLSVREIGGTDHWAIHQRTGEVVRHCADFLVT